MHSIGKYFTTNQYLDKSEACKTENRGPSQTSGKTNRTARTAGGRCGSGLFARKAQKSSRTFCNSAFFRIFALRNKQSTPYV